MSSLGMNFLSDQETSVTSTPEAALAVAVLHRAVLDCLAEGVPAPVRRSAYFYLKGDDRSWPFAFSNVAEFLSDDVEALRATIFKFLKTALGTENLESLLYESPKPRGASDRMYESAMRRNRPSSPERMRRCRRRGNLKAIGGA